MPGVSLEVSLPDFNADDLSWSSIEPRFAFSAAELGNATGEVYNVGASAVFVGYSVLALTAYMPDKRAMFWQQKNDGLSVGVELKPLANVGTGAGKFYSLGQVLRDYLIPVVNLTLVSAGFGLVMAGQALLQGRGLAVSYSYCNGYARRLADITHPGRWEISDDRYYQLLELPWERVVERQGKLYRETGSTPDSSLLTEVETAGEASVIQDVAKLYDAYGEEWCLKQFDGQRSLYGEQKDARRKRYLDVLYAQVKAGTKIGINLGA